MLVVASPTTNNAYATAKVKFVPDTFMVPPPPTIADYTWNILEPEILKAGLRRVDAHRRPQRRRRPSPATKTMAS